MARVIVALSGGVDSAVAALLLRDAGHEVEALFMSNWEQDEDGYCTAAADWQDSRAIAGELGIALHKVSFAAEYRDRVFAHFLAELLGEASLDLEAHVAAPVEAGQQVAALDAALEHRLERLQGPLHLQRAAQGQEIR